MALIEFFSVSNFVPSVDRFLRAILSLCSRLAKCITWYFNYLDENCLRVSEYRAFLTKWIFQSFSSIIARAVHRSCGFTITLTRWVWAIKEMAQLLLFFLAVTLYINILTLVIVLFVVKMEFQKEIIIGMLKIITT